MTQNRRSIVVGLIGVIGGVLLGLGAGYQLWAGGTGETQRIPIEGSEKKAVIKDDRTFGLSVWLPATEQTKIYTPGPKIGEHHEEAGMVKIFREGAEQKIITGVKVDVPGGGRILRINFYPENGAVKHIDTRTPDGDFIGTAEFRKDGTVKSLQRYKSNKKSTKWKFDREGNIVDEYSVGHSWD